MNKLAILLLCFITLNGISKSPKRQVSGTEKKNEYTEKLKKSIKKRYSFFKGFEEKTYHSFSKDNLETIKMILK